jgi:hypothetical protein
VSTWESAWEAKHDTSKPTNPRLKSWSTSGYLTVCHGKSQFLIGKPSINGQFSMAMLNNQRVHLIANLLDSLRTWSSQDRSTSLLHFWVETPRTKGHVGEHHRANIPCSQMTQEMSQSWTGIYLKSLLHGSIWVRVWKTPISLEHV